MDVILSNVIHKGDVCSLNINGQVFNVEGTIDDTNKVKAVSVEQATDASGKINVKLNRECFRNDIPNVKITDDQGQELVSYTDFTAYDLNKDILTINMKNTEKQVGNYKLTIGNSEFDISLKSIIAQTNPNIVSVQVIAPKILKITYDKDLNSKALEHVNPTIREDGSDNSNTNIYAREMHYNKNITYEKLNTSLVSGHSYILTFNNKDFNIKLSNDSQYNVSISNISSVDESTVKFKLNNTFPEDIPKSLFVDICNQYGNSVNGSTTTSASGDTDISFSNAVFKPDVYYIDCNGTSYNVSSVTSKSDALKVTSMSLTGDKTLSIKFNKTLDLMPYFIVYSYYDNWVAYNYSNTKVSGNSLNLVLNDSTDLKTCKIIINGTCYYVKDYVK